MSFDQTMWAILLGCIIFFVIFVVPSLIIAFLMFLQTRRREKQNYNLRLARIKAGLPENPPVTKKRVAETPGYWYEKIVESSSSTTKPPAAKTEQVKPPVKTEEVKVDTN